MIESCHMEHMLIDPNSRQSLYESQVELYIQLESNLMHQMAHVNEVLNFIEITENSTSTLQTFPEWWNDQVVNVLKIIKKVEEDVDHFIDSNKSGQPLLGIAFISARIYDKLTPQELSTIKICTNQIISLVKAELEVIKGDQTFDLKAEQLSNLRGGGLPIEDYMKANYPLLFSSTEERELVALTGITKDKLEEVTGLEENQIWDLLRSIQVLEGVTEAEYRETIKNMLENILDLTDLSSQELVNEAKLKMESLRILMDQPTDLFDKLSRLVVSLQLALITVNLGQR